MSDPQIITGVQLLPNGIVQVQTASTVASLAPGDDLTAQPADLAAVCEAWWTPERRTAYAALFAAATEATEQEHAHA